MTRTWWEMKSVLWQRERERERIRWHWWMSYGTRRKRREGMILYKCYLKFEYIIFVLLDMLFIYYFYIYIYFKYKDSACERKYRTLSICYEGDENTLWLDQVFLCIIIHEGVTLLTFLSTKPSHFKHLLIIGESWQIG